MEVREWLAGWLISLASIIIVWGKDILFFFWI